MSDNGVDHYLLCLEKLTGASFSAQRCGANSSFLFRGGAWESGDDHTAFLLAN
jgi:hypothetical protein